MRKPNEYSWLKGFNYVPSYAQNAVEFWQNYDGGQIERELEYARRLGLNCARVFLSYVVYRADPEAFAKHVRRFVECAWQKGIRTMPVVWDSCFSEDEPTLTNTENKWFPNPGPMYLLEQYWPEQQEYCDRLIQTLAGHPGLLLWDIHNEPLCTSYVSAYEGEEKARHTEEIWRFVRHYCEYFFHRDPGTPVTVGVHEVDQLEVIGDWCGVLSFHDYSPSQLRIQAAFDKAEEYARRQKKPVFCSEMGCPSRANPYGVAIETAMQNHMGYFLWELMIGRSFWNDRHGIVYPDGTIRDAATVAAIRGFFRNRGTRKELNLDVEGVLTQTVKKAEAWLENPDPLQARELLQQMANLLEGGERVPLADLPSAAVRALQLPEEMPKVRELVTQWLPVLKKDQAAG